MSIFPRRSLLVVHPHAGAFASYHPPNSASNDDDQSCTPGTRTLARRCGLRTCRFKVIPRMQLPSRKKDPGPRCDGRIYLELPPPQRRACPVRQSSRQAANLPSTASGQQQSLPLRQGSSRRTSRTVLVDKSPAIGPVEAVVDQNEAPTACGRRSCALGRSRRRRIAQREDHCREGRQGRAEVPHHQHGTYRVTSSTLVSW